MKTILVLLTALFTFPAFAAETTTLYFSCVVKESIEGEKVNVTVKFAIENYNSWDKTGNLLQYPGLAQNVETEYDSLLITPRYVGPEQNWTRMSNLNAQGGDLTLNRDGSILLWGDGDGYQFTDLVVWDIDRAIDNAEEGQENFKLEGYVRDYGPAFMGKIDFKQFIKCDMSTKVL